ncbi:MAG: hypothetical protein H6Q05_2224, partial [Acidobacteria bacterium]|nr:hypothetical protein [Acidobacteriota bacterium]
MRTRLDWFGGRGSRSGPAENRRIAFRLMYERFREILACNDATLELIAHIEELLGGKCHYSHRSMVQRVRKAAMGVFLMVKDLNLIADRRHQALYGALHGLNDLLEAELAPAG